MSPSLLPRFLELPNELQIHMGRFAAVNADTDIYILIDYWSPDDQGRSILEEPYARQRIHIYRVPPVIFRLRLAHHYRESYLPAYNLY